MLTSVKDFLCSLSLLLVPLVIPIVVAMFLLSLFAEAYDRVCLKLGLQKLTETYSS